MRSITGILHLPKRLYAAELLPVLVRNIARTFVIILSVRNVDSRVYNLNFELEIVQGSHLC